MKPNVPYHLALLEGRTARELYRAMLQVIVRHQVRVPRGLDLNVFTYSGENSLPEQVASIRSFLAYAGQPKQFTVLSDGSYSTKSITLLEKIDDCVRVQQIAPSLPLGLPENVTSFFKNHFTGKQLALIMSLPLNGTALYTDADVLFFPGAQELAQLSQTQSISAFYQPDYQFSGDDRLIQDENEKKGPANMGFLLLFKKLDWTLGLERLRAFDGVPSFFTTQTVTHLCLHANGARSLDPTKVVLKLDDQTIYRDKYAKPSLIARHYVSPVRHKFWTTLAHRGFN
ncbi:MAG: hypothetical protein JO201_02175 [Verrucomicrobia bacterium]|nr:hypothetical protein [Verrucomicrobiota bacterium]